MRISWLYLHTRSVRDSEPVLICPAAVATARSAMKVSSVSPERCDTTTPYLAFFATVMASSVSVSVPIWLTLMRMALAIFLLMPCLSVGGWVTKKIVAHELDFLAQRRRQFGPAFPVVLIHAVFDGINGIPGTEIGVKPDHLRGAQGLARALMEHVLARAFS